MTAVKKMSSAPKNDVEASAASVAAVCAPDRGDISSVPRSGEPVVNRGPNLAALDRRFAGPMVAGDEQENPLITANRKRQSTVDRVPRAVEIHSVEIKYPVRLDIARSEPPVPSPVEGRSGSRSNRNEGNDRARRSFGDNCLWSSFGLFLRILRAAIFTR